MAWKDLRKIKDMPLGMALGTISKMIAGQSLKIRPKQLKKLEGPKLEQFEERQEQEREKLFMIFANHFPAPEDVVEAREDFLGFANFLYGTYTLRFYLDFILAEPRLVEAMIEIYVKDEQQLTDLTYELDRRTAHVEAFGRALKINPAEIAEQLENYNGNATAFVAGLNSIEEPVIEYVEEDLAEEYGDDDENGAEQEEIREAV